MVVPVLQYRFVYFVFYLMNIFRYILILILTFSSFNSFAESIKIYGKVRDNENKPIEFATVRIDQSAIGTNTDLQGNYSLSVAVGDTINIVYSSVGYKTVKHKLINQKTDVQLSVKLYPENYTLDELEVKRYRGVVNGMQSFDIASVDNSPDISGGSVESLLTMLPGVNSSNELTSRYSVRGGSFDENSVYINGVEIYRPQLQRNGQQEGLSIINPDLVENIKFSSGGFPARYTDRMSSALDIRYRNPKKFETSIGLSLMGGSLSVGANHGKFSMLHGVRVKKNNSLLSSLETRGEYDPLYIDYQTCMSYYMSDRWSVSFLGNVSSNNFNFTPSDRETSFGIASDLKKFKVYFDGEEQDRFNTYLGALSLNFNRSKSSIYSLSLSGFHTSEYVSYDISGEYWLNQAGSSGEDDRIGGELGVGKYMEHARDRLKASVISAAFRGVTKVGRNNLSFGFVFSHEKFIDRTKEWEWRDSAGYSLPTGPDGVHLIYNLRSHNDVSNNRYAAYLEDAFYFENSKAYMTLNAGVRCSYWDFNNEFLLSPRLNFNISPARNNNINYRLALGIYYQSPFYKEYRKILEDETGNCVVSLNGRIKSPRSMLCLAGADFTFQALGRPFKVSGEVYYKSLSNLISYEYDNLKVVYSGINDSKGFIAGLDFKLFGQFVPGSDSWLSFSLMKTQQKLNGKNVPLPSDQRYSVNLYFTDYFPKFPKLKFSLRGIISDGLTMTAPRISRDVAYFRAPAYKRVDIGLTYRLIGGKSEGVVKRDFRRYFKSLNLGIDLFNLFDNSNVSDYYWVTDVNNLQYAVPNYLTRRQLNFKISAEF